MVTTSEHMKKSIQNTITKIHVWPYVQRFTAEQRASSNVDTCHNTHKHHLDCNLMRAWRSQLEK